MSHVKVIQKGSVADEVQLIEERVARRAYELFERRGSPPGDPWADWFAAERELVRRPAIEVREEAGALLVSASIAGIDPGDIRVEVTQQDVVITDVESDHVQPPAHLHQSEFRPGRLFRSVHLPLAIDLAQVQAVCRNGVLTMKAPIAH